MDRSRLVEMRQRSVSGISGPLIFAHRLTDVCYEASVSIESPGGQVLTGQVLDLSEELVTIQVLGSTHGLIPEGTVLRYSDSVFQLPVSSHMLGRVLDGKGAPIDGLPRYPANQARPISASAINPVSRAVPSDYVETGITAIDLMNTLAKGQKLPIFSCAGLPSNEVASLIIRNAATSSTSEREFFIVFAGMGVTHRDALYFERELRSEGALDRTVVFLNRADEPVIERLMAPRCALTAAEYLAFTLGHDVLVVLNDMTHYCEALREVSSAREEIAGRRGYPGYMYTDLASIYERAGRILGCAGSITQLPILTMPDDDITHPIADLTGYITEGQIVLDRNLHRLGVNPPINPLPSLSRLMDKVAGVETPPDHKLVSDQLYSLYAQAQEVRQMAELVSEENLSDNERELLGFAGRFEAELLGQGGRARGLGESLDASYRLLAGLNASLLDRVTPEMIEEHMRRDGG